MVLAAIALFTTDKPVLFAYHGYPWLIHRLTYRRTNRDKLHVRGYKEEGTTTTPVDMLVRNDMDRFQLVIDALDRVPGLRVSAARFRQDMVDERQRHRTWIREHGEALPEIRDWTWPCRAPVARVPRVAQDKRDTLPVAVVSLATATGLAGTSGYWNSTS